MNPVPISVKAAVKAVAKGKKVCWSSRIDGIAEKHHFDTVAKLSIDPRLSHACDKGLMELFEGDWLEGLLDKLIKL